MAKGKQGAGRAANAGINRNGLCPCGSGAKYKHCCGSPAALAATRKALDTPLPIPPAARPGPSVLNNDIPYSPPVFGISPDKLAAAVRSNAAIGAAEAELQRPQAGQAKKYLGTAEELAKKHRWAEAIVAWRRAAELAPNDATVHFALGMGCLSGGNIDEAASAFLQAVKLRPSYVEAHYRLGIVFERQGDLVPAIAAFRETLKLKPSWTDAAFRLSGLLVSHGARQEAAQVLRTAAEAQGTDAALSHLARGTAFSIEEKPSEAHKEYRLSLSKDTNKPAAWRLLGTSLVTAGELEEAREALQRALKLDSQDAAALRELLRATRVNESHRPLVARVEARLRGRDLSPRLRMTLHFALGKAFDELREYEAAMGQFDAANAIRGQLFPFDRDACVAGVDKIISNFPAVQEDTEGASDSERPIFILGMPRSGTTLVEQIISAHSAVAAGGERRFWVTRSPQWADAVKTGQSAPFLREATADFLTELSEISPDALRVTDKNPYNFQWAGLIREALPNAFIIHCRRDPVDICLSIYTNSFSSRTDFASSRGDLVFFYRQYLRLMDHWRRVLPPHRFLEVDYAQLVENQEAKTRELVDFCGLPWDPACLQPERNRRAVYTASLMQVRQPVYKSSLARWRRYEPWLGELLELHTS